MEQPKKHSVIKRILLALAGLVVVAFIASSTVFLLSHLTTKTETVNLTPKQQAKLAKESLDSATSHEAKGETDAAIAKYKEALKHYQDSGDKAGVEAVKLQITYLESVKRNSSNSTAPMTTPTDPTTAPTYTTAVPGNTP